MTLSGLDLFSGIGGISMALRPWVTTIAYCECEPYAQAVLMERMQSNDLDYAPIWDDVRTLNSEILDTQIDIIFGGFPCQDISWAGKQLGINSDTRSGLFFHIMRLVREFQPEYIFLENVAAICSKGLDTVLREVAEAGYDAEWCCVSAAEVGAPHCRDRWWLLAITDDKGLQRQRLSRRIQSEKPMPDSLCDHRFPAGRGEQFDWEPPRTVSKMGRNSNGIPYRIHRIKALGNSVVPQAAREAFRRLIMQNQISDHS